MVMKKLTFFLFVIASVILTGACSSDKESFDGFDYSGKTTVKFTSQIEKTRVSGNSWQMADAVGMYAIEEGKELSDVDIFEGKKNIKYTTATNGPKGQFVAAVPNTAIQVSGKTKIDVISYYPFQEEIKDYNYVVNVENQSKQSEIDVLYSNNAKSIDASKDNLLTFKHALASLVVNILPTTGETFPDIVVTSINNVKLQGNLNLKNGEVTILENSTVANLAPVAKKTTKARTFTVVALPGQTLSDFEIVATVNGVEKVFAPKDDSAMVSGTKYTYDLGVDSDGKVTFAPDADIQDWEEGNTGGLDEIGDDTGKDPETNPDVLTIAALRTTYADAIKNPIIIDKDVFVEGEVISTDAYGNIFKKLVIQDETSGIAFKINIPNKISETYALGQKLKINLKGLAVSHFGESLQIVNAANKDIEPAVFATAVVSNTEGGKVLPKLSTFNEVNDATLNMLIKLDNVSFKEAGQPFYKEGDKGGTNRTLVDADGKELVLRTSNFAAYKAELLPEGKGSVIVIVEKHFANYQLTMRNIDDATFGNNTPEANENITLDKTSLKFTKEASIQELQVSSEDAVEWTVESSVDWISVDPIKASGNKTVKISVLANSNEARTANVVFKGLKNSITVTVSQETGKVVEGKEVEFFKESFSKLPLNMKVASFSEQYKQYVDNPELEYSLSYEKDVLRSTKTIAGHIWYAASNQNIFKIANLEASGYSDIKLKFSLVANQPNATDASVMSVKVNGLTLEALPTEKLAGGNDYKEFELNVPNAESGKLTIEIIGDLTGASQGVRLNHIKLVGVK